MVRPFACGSKMLTGTVRKYEAAKTEMLVAVRFTENFWSHLEGRELILRVYNIALKWLKTYSMSWFQVVSGCVSNTGVREKHSNADGLSKN